MQLSMCRGCKRKAAPADEGKLSIVDKTHAQLKVLQMYLHLLM